jgi:predicted  nucleic acid-binding Zn-ribbon protein
MAEPTLTSLYNSYITLKKSVSGIESRVKVVEDKFAAYVSTSELNTESRRLEALIQDANDTIETIETKLQKIELPADTRYYLEEAEITDFRNHFRQLRVFFSEVENSRKAMIRLLARYNLTSSSL